MPIGDVLRHIRQLHLSPGSASTRRSKQDPSGRSASTSAKTANVEPGAGKQAPFRAAVSTPDRNAPAPPEGTTAPAPDEAAATPAAASVSFATRLGQLPLEGWWDDGGNDVSVDVRAASRGQLIVLRLSPPTIGPLTVVLTLYERGLKAQIVVENDDDAGRITALLPQLRLSLAEIFHVEEIRVVERPPTVTTSDSSPKQHVDMNA